MRFFLASEVVPRLHDLARAIIKPPVAVNVAVRDLLVAWGPHRISSFVCIGANDGLKNDPIAGLAEKYGWRGIMVEPQPRNFARLEHNFCGNQRIDLENCGMCKSMMSQPGLMDHMTWETKPIGAGMLSVCSVEA